MDINQQLLDTNKQLTAALKDLVTLFPVPDSLTGRVAYYNACALVLAQEKQYGVTRKGHASTYGENNVTP